MGLFMAVLTPKVRPTACMRAVLPLPSVPSNSQSRCSPK